MRTQRTGRRVELPMSSALASAIIRKGGSKEMGQPNARCHSAVAHHIPNNTPTLLSLEVVDFDTDNMIGQLPGWDPSVNMRCYIHQVGLYQFAFAVRWAPSGGGGLRQIGLSVNGTAFAELTVPPINSGTVPTDMSLRSEERRVGKECRSGWSPKHE